MNDSLLGDQEKEEEEKKRNSTSLAVDFRLSSFLGWLAGGSDSSQTGGVGRDHSKKNRGKGGETIHTGRKIGSGKIYTVLLKKVFALLTKLSEKVFLL